MSMSRPAIAATFFFVAPMAPISSFAAEPTKQECVAANESAQDLRRVAQLREARTRLALCVSASCPGPVREDCALQLREVDAAMPTLVLVAKDMAGNDLSAVMVTMDGLPFANSLDGSAVQVDPGEHQFVFESAGQPAMEKVLVVREGDKNRHVSVVFGAAQPYAPETAEHRTSSFLQGDTKRLVALGLGGAGALGLVIGTVLGLVAKSTYDHAVQDECGGNTKNCSAAGTDDGRSAHDLATGATVAFVGGVLLLAGGAVVYVLGPKANRVAMTPALRTDGAGLQVKAVW